MGKLIDLTGRRFGRLVVIERSENSKDGKACWLCHCDCGKNVTVRGKDLRTEKQVSCGCMKKERVANINKLHGQRNSRLYRIWCAMKCRTQNSNAWNYKYYGGKGVSICPEWHKSFMLFQKWAMNNGYNDNLTIERIDNDKGYSPDNCRWIEQQEQKNNTSRNIFLTFNGETNSIARWAKKLKIGYSTIYARLKRGWTVEQALTQPIKKQTKGTP